MARRARFSDFDGVITEEMLSDRQRAISFVSTFMLRDILLQYVKLVRQWVYLQVPAYTLICIN